MSNFISTTSDQALEMVVRTENFVRDLIETMGERAREERGQTAAEYLGVLVVVSVIIAVVSKTGVGDQIEKAISKVVTNIAGGKTDVTKD